MIEDMDRGEVERRVGGALLTARRKLQSLNGEKPSGSDVVFEVIKEMVDIERRMKVRVASPKHLRAQQIDYVHEAWEREEAAKQARIDEAAGDDPAVVWGITLIATPDEMKRLDAVKTMFREGMVGHNKLRDWKILQKLGQGLTIRKVARQHRISHSRVSDIKGLQCAAIWTEVSRLLPALGVGQVWREAA